MARPISNTSRANKKLLARRNQRRWKKHINELEKKIKSAAEKGVFEASKKVMQEAKGIVPIDTGYLRSTGFVDRPAYSGGAYKGRVGFRAHYAAAVHARKPFLLMALSRQTDEVKKTMTRGTRHVVADIEPLHTVS